MTIYYNPDQYGYSVFGELDEAEMYYEFNMLVVFLREVDSKLFYGTDSGCSCPAPFEDVTDEDLTPIELHTYDAFVRVVTDFPANGPDKVELLRKVQAAL